MDRVPGREYGSKIYGKENHSKVFNRGELRVRKFTAAQAFSRDGRGDNY